MDYHTGNLVVAARDQLGEMDRSKPLIGFSVHSYRYGSNACEGCKDARCHQLQDLNLHQPSFVG